jgi:uncharacterized Zn-finger protein
MLSPAHSKQGRSNPKMAGTSTPKFHNDTGERFIEIGAKEFECIGTKPPFDHPHIFIDMGDEQETVCPYCSTLYRYDPSLPRFGARPAGALYTEDAG